MDRNFSRSLSAVLVHEGGYVNHPNDPGGPTNRGVTLANFRRFVNPAGTVADLKALTVEQAGVVFRRQYWDEVMGSALPDGVDHAVFDFAVNSGPGRAAKYLQGVVGAKQDGKIGPATIKAAQAMDAAKIINALCDKRQKFLEGLAIYATFGKGWTRRVAEVRGLALELAGQPAESERVVVEHVEVPVETPIVPKGADKPGLGRWFAAVPLLGTPITAFGGLDNITKGIIVAAIVIGIAALLLRGEQIAARAKAVLKSFEG